MGSGVPHGDYGLLHECGWATELFTDYPKLLFGVAPLCDSGGFGHILHDPRGGGDCGVQETSEEFPIPQYPSIETVYGEI